ncbi:hypothetical protein SLS62_010056 [Diatrype stigma]|uniref:Eukaryotic membrane protein family-domain-containing protein n=1 Tax=Diatrype stigma TaxID=117547 RepID=A0AAN9YJ12_9PEZI
MAKRTSSSSSIATVPFPDLDPSSATPTQTSASNPPPVPTSADAPKKTRTQSNVPARRDSHESIRKLSASQMQALAAAPESLPIAIVPPTPPMRKPNGVDYPMSASVVESGSHLPISMAEQMENGPQTLPKRRPQRNGTFDVDHDVSMRTAAEFRRPISTRTLSTPPINRRTHTPSTSVPVINAARRYSFNPLGRPAPLNLNVSTPAGSARVPSKSSAPSKADTTEATAPPPIILPPIPLPPMSLPTHLQLELAGQRPSPLYIYQSHAADAIYESSAVKFERLLNALLLPPYLEKMLVFGTLACLDAWLYTFTILPMRFCIALGVLIRWWGHVGDRLLAAIGQDVIECLFSSETLSRNSSGRSKILLPFGMFILSLIYNVVHVLCLFYQVITLNVAVNSYSNTLLTLLISNQFVEIKGAVFKKIEKENLFQLSCADIVERFQLWVILLIIAMRNIVEVGGFSVPGAGSEMDNGATGPGPIHTNSILPHSFTVWPSWLFSGEVLSPFFVVIGIEMLVDWIKHAYINKFNNVRPAVYHRMLDILCKDYYTNAFGTPSLTRRIGLPVIPLSCLFIRASMQIYHMFLSTYLPPPIPTSTMELSVESSTPSSPAMVAALERLDTIIRNALGRSVHGDPLGNNPTASPAGAQAKSFWTLSSDDAIALLTMLLFFFLAWIVLLIIKLVLGMVLLRYARRRYAVMVHKEKMLQHQQDEAAREREREPPLSQPGSKRIGAWGATEVGDERRRWLYDDDPDGLRRMRERERKTEEKFREHSKGGADDGLARVCRYEMGVSKRIW